MDPTKPLAAGSLDHMVHSQPEHYSAVLQVRLAEELTQPVTGLSFHPRRYQVTVSDGSHWTRMLAGGRLREEIENGTFANWTIIDVMQYETATPRGSQWNIVTILNYYKLREPGRPEGRTTLPGLTIGHHAVGTGSIRSIGHLSLGFPSQLHAAQLDLAMYADYALTWRTVHAAGLSDEQPDPVAPIERAIVSIRPDNTIDEDTGLNVARVAQIRSFTVMSCLYARVFKVNEPRTYVISKGKMTTRAMAILIDETGEIELVGFDMYFKSVTSLSERKVYRFERFAVQASPEVYNRVPHPFRLIVTGETRVVEIHDNGVLPYVFYNWVKVSEIERLELNQTVDIMAVVDRVSRPMLSGNKVEGKSAKSHKSSASMDRMDVWLVDDTGCCIRLAAFDEFLAQLLGTEGRVVSIKTALVTQLAGVCLKTQRGETQLMFEDNNLAHRHLAAWYATAKNTRSNWRTLTSSYSADGAPRPNFTPPTETVTIRFAQEKKFGRGSRKSFYIIGNVEFNAHRADYIYKGDPWEFCNSGLDKARWNSTKGMYECKCGQDYVAPGRKFHLNFQIKDGTGTQWVNLFNGLAERLFHETAGTMDDWRNSKGEPRQQYIRMISAPNDKRWKMAIEVVEVKMGQYKGKLQWEVKEMQEV